MGPAKAINGEGLAGDLPALTGGHGTGAFQHWWTFAGGIPEGAQITIDLNGEYQISTIQIWNYNENGVTVRGTQNAEIYVSPDEDPSNLVKLVTSGDGDQDNGSGDFLLPQGPASADYAGFNLDLSGVTNLGLLDQVRLVQIIPLDSYDDSAGVGLAEIQFAGIPSSEVAGDLDLLITSDGTTLEFSWTSSEGKSYDLVSTTDLSVAVSEWQVYEGNEGILASPPTNALTGVALDGSKRFFALIEN
jgi:hypothetical protein